MTDDKTEKPEVRYCRYLTRWLKEAYQNGDLPSSFKDETVEFQSFWVRDGWDIYWVLHGKQLDSVHINRQKSNDWKEADLEEWSKEVVAGWIDAYLHPQIDQITLDLDEEEFEGASTSSIETPASSNGMDGEVTIDWSSMWARPTSPKDPKIVQKLRELQEQLGKSQEAAARKNPLGIIRAVPMFDLTLTGSEAGAWTNVKMQPERIPLQEVGTLELDKTISKILNVQTRLNHRNRMVVVEFSPESLIHPLSIDDRMWQQFDCGHIVRRLKDHVHNCQKRLRGPNEG